MKDNYKTKKQLIKELMKLQKRIIELEALKSESKKVEEKLKESRTHFKTLFNNLVDPVVIVDSKGNFLEVTDRVEELTGFKKQDLIGKNFLKINIVTKKSKEILISNLMKRMAGVEIKPYEIEVLTKDGKKLQYEVNATKINYKGKPAVLNIFRDINERKRAEDEAHKIHLGLVKAHEELQHAFEDEKLLRDQLIQSEKLVSLGQMGAKIAHEINNPLTVIRLSAQLWQHREINEKLKKTFDIIDLESQRIKNITSTYMNLSRPTPPKKEALNLNDVVEEGVKNLITTGEIKHYEIRKNFQLDIPKVNGDRDRLIQVFRNLIVNASHAMADRESQILTLGSSISKDRKFVEVSIQDTGCGIEKEKLDKIFKIYYTTKMAGVGTGLGLVVVKDIIEKQHKGKIWVESEVNKGTTFTVQLPLEVEKEKNKILVVDDDIYIRNTLADFLEDKNLSVLKASNGQEAFNLFKRYQPDVVISDIQMPIMNGFELIERIKKEKPNQRIIMMTGFGYEFDIRERLENSNIPYFTQPANLHAVLKMIQDELKR